MRSQYIVRLLKSGQNEKSQKNGAVSRKFFGPSYFVTALETELSFYCDFFLTYYDVRGWVFLRRNSAHFQV